MLITKHWFGRQSFFILIGMAGVHPDESPMARAWGKFFGYALILIAVIMLIEWQTPTINQRTYPQIVIVNWSIWLFFIAQLTVLLSVVKNRPRFMLQNWLLPIIVVIGWPIFLDLAVIASLINIMRPVLAIIFILSAMRLLASFFVDGKLKTTLLATFFIVVIFGLLVAGVDPNIRSAWDGIWWALATVSTVGYGDVVPSSFFGRLIGACLVILGLGVFVVLTANFLALTLRKETERFKEEELEISEIFEEVEKMHITQLEILHLVRQLENRIDRVSAEASKNPPQLKPPANKKKS